MVTHKHNEGRIRVNSSVVQRARELGIDPGETSEIALKKRIKLYEQLEKIEKEGTFVSLQEAAKELGISIVEEEVPGSAVTDK